MSALEVWVLPIDEEPICIATASDIEAAMDEVERHAKGHITHHGCCIEGMPSVIATYRAGSWLYAIAHADGKRLRTFEDATCYTALCALLDKAARPRPRP